MDVRTIRLFVSFSVVYPGKFELELANGEIISERMDDPIDFVLDMNNIFNKNKSLNLDNAMIEIYAPSNDVVNRCRKDTRQMIPVYVDTFQNTIENTNILLHVPQYRYSSYLLYVNGCKYLKSLSNIYTENS